MDPTVIRGCVLALCLAAAAPLRLLPAPPNPRAPRRPAADQPDGLSAAQVPAAGDIERLIGQLDSAHYQLRNRATRALTAQGVAAVPHLVKALEHGSRETRFRAGQLLRHHYTFEQVGRPLLDFASRSPSRTARSILYERALRQLDAVSRMQSVEQLFEFWGTSMAAFRRRILNQLDGAQAGGDPQDCITPLLEISSKAERFAQATTRLKELSLAYESQYSAAYVVAHTLAQGLRTDNGPAIDFAQDYLDALARLAEQLAQDDESRSRIRKAVTDRAVFSQGAAEYLARVITAPGSPAARRLRACGLTAGELRREFFRGLAAADQYDCYRRVGKVHIADMLTEVLVPWPDALADALVRQLIDATVGTVHTGDKPKALALLAALQACRELPAHGLSLREGLGQQLAERLAQGALAAENNRAFHATQAMHDRLLAVVACGVTPQHDAFPREVLDRYLAGRPQAVSDAQRLALERYGGVLKRLREAAIPYEDPGVNRYLSTLRAHLRTDPELVHRGLLELMKLLARQPAPHTGSTAASVAPALAKWTAQVTTLKPGTGS